MVALSGLFPRAVWRIVRFSAAMRVEGWQGRVAGLQPFRAGIVTVPDVPPGLADGFPVT